MLLFVNKVEVLATILILLDNPLDLVGSLAKPPLITSSVGFY